MAKVDEVENAIIKCFVAFVVKMNEGQLRPQLVKLLKTVQKASQGPLPFNLHKSLVFFKLMTSILNHLKELFLPSYSLYFEFQLGVLGHANQVLGEFRGRREGQR